jgi:macrolide transport system ATP-binding/permease protein
MLPGKSSSQGAPNTIIGVMPTDFHFAPAEPAEFWAAGHDENSSRGCHSLFGLGRLKTAS